MALAAILADQLTPLSIIGQLKVDGLLELNNLACPEGDSISVILCASGHNMRLLARWIRLLFALLIDFNLNTKSLNQQRH